MVASISSLWQLTSFALSSPFCTVSWRAFSNFVCKSLMTGVSVSSVCFAASLTSFACLSAAATRRCSDSSSNFLRKSWMASA
uniref:Uncharacterized protein n=1 Tax=Ixodes ricinus TaxID=34613 RepID=A0A6B0U798_IXORI